MSRVTGRRPAAERIDAKDHARRDAAHARAAVGAVCTLASIGKRWGVGREHVRLVEARMTDKLIAGLTGCTVDEIERQIALGLTDDGRSLAGKYLDELIRDAMGAA